jgi:hypothetical protein
LLSARRVLTMEWVDGAKLPALPPRDQRRMVAAGLDACFAQLLGTGVSVGLLGTGVSVELLGTGVSVGLLGFDALTFVRDPLVKKIFQPPCFCHCS